MFGPFILLAVFLVRGAILPGADIGVKFYLTPDLEKLKDPKVATLNTYIDLETMKDSKVTPYNY